uniref:NADH-ubiquinone oxidoreductase chain 6 n=1 Tax=Ludioschema sulcicolle TaxID=2803645 RepID=A0A7T8V5S8_9COLE|nr:NADH dehydrogenase subunit 6 [Ludioschema sulcicolle]QQQ88058.1 NADH dehydrogenase subunit 6 [Ludioschema sulcicolle]
MTQVLLLLTFTMSLTFMFLSHPLSMGLTLLVQAILIAMITGMISHNFWFAYILFMVMIGGMLVLFIYMTSVASNEKFLYSNKLMFTMMAAMSFILMLPFIDSFPIYQISTNMDMMFSSSSPMFQLSLSKYINMPSNWIMISMIIYLLVTLIAVVKITNITYGPLRQKF